MKDLKRKIVMMNKKLFSISVNGKSKKWTFLFHEDYKYLKEWREDGLEIDEIINVIPVWVVESGLTRPWIFFQDLFNFKFLKR